MTLEEWLKTPEAAELRKRSEERTVREKIYALARPFVAKWKARKAAQQGASSPEKPATPKYQPTGGPSLRIDYKGAEGASK